MGFKFREYDQDQMFLLPPSIKDWVREGSLAEFVNDTVDHLEERGWLQGFYERYRTDGWGAWAYHPRMLVKVWLYAYCHGIHSSRKIAWCLENDVSFRYLAANQQPNFRTVCLFRQLNQMALEELFVSVLALCKEAGLVKMGRVALDGHKVPGNASLKANRKAKALRQEIREFLDEAEQVDAEEDEQYGTDRRGDELPEDLRSRAGRLKRLNEALDRLEREAEEARRAQEEKLGRRKARQKKKKGRQRNGRKPKDPDQVYEEKLAKAQANVTDPESRLLKTERGFIQGYNGQAMVDCESQVIVAQAVTQDASDVHQLEAMLVRCEWQAAVRPKQLLADTGYWSEANAGLEDAETELFIATRKDWKQARALQAQPPPRGRIPAAATPRDLMERKLRTRRGRAAYRERSKTVEPVFGQFFYRGLLRFALRGFNKVAAEWATWCTTHNLLKLWRAGWRPALG